MTLKHVFSTLLALSLVASATHSAGAGVIYSEDFESGAAPGFDFTTGGLWHVTSNFPAGGTYALGYVQNETAFSSIPDGDYNTGVSGAFHTAFSPLIDLTVGSSFSLSFQAFNHVENDIEDAGNPDAIDPDPDNYDKLTVWASTDTTLTGGDTLLASSSTTDGVQVIDNWTVTGDNYKSYTVDLSQFAGQSIHLAFNFFFGLDDALLNDHPGARIDNIEVESASTAVPEPGSLTLWGIGAIGLFGCCRRWRRKGPALVA